MADTVLKKEDKNKNKANALFFCYWVKTMNKSKKVIFEILSYVAIIVLVILFKTYVASPIRVNGSSMDETLHDKDIMILNEFIYYFDDINRLDIVVVKEKGELLIKRVIALPGETIECKDGYIYVNDKKIIESYVSSETEDFEKVEVGKDEYFVMGDNRAVSLDSRVYGVYSKKDVKGKATFTIYPFDRFGKKK